VRAETAEKVRTILREQVRLSSDVDKLGHQDDLFQAGLSSHASVNLMLALEGGFDIEFPDEMLKRSTFESIASISDAVDTLLGDEVAA